TGRCHGVHPMPHHARLPLGIAGRLNGNPASPPRHCGASCALVRGAIRMPAPLQGSPPQSSVREAFTRALLRALMTDPRGCSVATAHGARVISASAAALGEGFRAERRLPVQALRAIGGVFPISLDRNMSE